MNLEQLGLLRIQQYEQDTSIPTSQSKIYTSTNRNFISHENNSGVIYEIRRGFQKSNAFDTNLEVFYTVSGSGANEVDLVSGSAIIPVGKSYVDILINPINNPNTVTADREIVLEIVPDPAYTISTDIGINKGILNLLVTDKMPLKAFPTAYGGGAYAKGGRGGNVYHVTRLDDEVIGGNATTGTFRWAIDQPRPSTIVFDVSGTVVLESSLIKRGNDLSIVGQTAPGVGISITNDGGLGQNNSYYKIEFQKTNNFIMRYVRFRSRLTSKGAGGAFSINANHSDSRHFIVDHCSFNWGGNSSFSVRGNLAQNGTMQRNIFAESKVGNLYGDSQQNEYSTNLSAHNNLWYNISHRTPNTGANGRVDNINNVVQNWYARLSNLVGDVRYNHINNYYALGLRTDLMNGSQMAINQLYPGFAPYLDYELTPFDYEIYTSGNIVDKGMHGLGDDNKLLWGTFDGGLQTLYAPPEVFTETQHPLLGAPLPIQTAQAFYNELTTNPNIGSNATLNADGSVNLGNDFIDNEYLAVMAQGEGSGEYYTRAEQAANRSFYTEQRYIDFLASISTTPISTRPVGFYVSNPHIPEAFLQAKGLIGTPTIHNEIAPSGYTWLEEYLNQVDL